MESECKVPHVKKELFCNYTSEFISNASAELQWELNFTDEVISSVYTEVLVPSKKELGIPNVVQGRSARAEA